MKNITFNLCVVALLLFTGNIYSQNSVGINVSITPNKHAVLELVSPENNQGFLMPRLTTPQRLDSLFNSNLGSSENGLLVFDKTENKMYFWQDSLWRLVHSGTLPNLYSILSSGNSAGNIRITDLAYPIDLQDAVNKRYADSLISTYTGANFDTLQILIAQNQTNITINQGRINSNSNQIKTNRDSIAILGNLVESNFNAIANNSNLIANNTSQITINVDSISINNFRITSLESLTQRHNDSIVIYRVYFDQIFDSLATHREEIDRIHDTISKLDSLVVSNFDTIFTIIDTIGLQFVVENNNSAANSQIKNLGTPTESRDAVHKQYVDDSLIAIRISIDTIFELLDTIIYRGILPNQAGNAGKYLRTNGDTTEWNILSTVAESGNMSDLNNDDNYVQATLSDNAIPRWDNANIQLRNSSIWDDGNSHILIGSDSDSIDVAYNLEVAGVFKTSKIYHSSDKRYKKNIQPLDSALQKVVALEGVSYEWKTEEYPQMKFSEGVQIGLIAQEIEKIYPELVLTDASGYKSVEYANIVAVLIEAIKEQQQIINTQNQKISELSAQNIGILEKLESLETAIFMLNTAENSAVQK